MALIKGLRFFIALTFLCAIGILLTSYPGEVTIGWFGYSISLPIGLFLTCLIVTFAFFTSLYGIWKWLWSLPNNYFTHLKSKRIKKGNNLLIDGLSAIAAGQNHEAKEVIGIACELLPDDPLTQFIAAQAANMTGDDESATKHYMSMQKDRRTSFLGLRGLILQAKSKEQYKIVQEYINKALIIRPDSPWLQQEYLSNTIQLAQRGIFPKTEKNKATKYISKADWSRHQAMLNWLKLQGSMPLANSEKEKLHLKVFELAPDWTENVIQLVEHYIQQESLSKAQKILMDSFKLYPHRSLGLLWDSVFNEMEAVDRYRTLEKLVSNQEDHSESQYCLASSAIKAQLWGQAKEHLDKLLSHGYTRASCNLMAELIENQYPSQFDLAREWWHRASQTSSDYDWQCNQCHTHFDRWQLICSNCQSTDQVYWQETSTAQRFVKGDLETARIYQIV